MVRVIVRVVRLMGATPQRWRMMAPSWPSLRVACHLARGYRLSASHQPWLGRGGGCSRPGWWAVEGCPSALVHGGPQVCGPCGRISPRCYSGMQLSLSLASVPFAAHPRLGTEARSVGRLRLRGGGSRDSARRREKRR